MIHDVKVLPLKILSDDRGKDELSFDLLSHHHK